MLKKYWKEYTDWLKKQWKEAWIAFKNVLYSLVEGIFIWLYTIFGSIIGGFWSLFLKPLLEGLKNWITELIKKM